MPDSLREHLQASLGKTHTIERELGGGGMSRVFLAEESRFRRKVVVKLLAPELVAGLSAERFEREIGLAAQLQHPNVVPVITAGDVDGLPWYTMPYVDGDSLRARMTGGPVPIVEAVQILRDVARALAYAHASGVVHRDIKPENVLLSGRNALVADFGIAKALSVAKSQTPGGTVTQVGTSLGTPAYMSPEQGAGDDLDHRADLYAWGVVAYELLAGAHPFAGKTTAQQLIAAHIAEAPAPLSSARHDLTAPLASIVMQCLAKDPADRPASASELLTTLEHASTLQGAPLWRIHSPLVHRKRIAGAIGIVAVVALGTWMVVSRSNASTFASRTAAQPERSIAVLPFESVGSDTANTYFAEGMADELTTALARVRGLRVAATSSAFTYRNTTPDAREVGKALDVNAVLQGRVRRAGSRLRVSVQLTNAADGLVLWSNSYDREVRDVFAVQDDLTRDIVAALRVAIGGGSEVGQSSARSSGTTSLEAYDLYLRGLHFLQRRGGGVAGSIPYFKQALEKDPSYASAWAQLGTAYSLLPYYELVSPDSTRQQARAAADSALRLNSSSAEAHVASGMSHLLANAWAPALGEFERALDLDPDYTLAYRASVPALYMLGRANDAIERGRLAVQSDPLSPTTWWVYSLSLLNGNRLTDGLIAARRGVELDSLNAMARAALAVAEYFSGRPDLARVTQRGVRRDPNTALWVGFVRAATGDRTGAATLIREIEQERGRNMRAESAIAWTYLGLGDTSRALDALERAAKAREPLAFVGAFGHPAYDAVRHSARFAAVIRAFGTDPRTFADLRRR